MRKSILLMLLLTTLLAISAISESNATAQATEFKSATVSSQYGKQEVTAQSTILVGVAACNYSSTLETDQLHNTLKEFGFAYVDVNSTSDAIAAGCDVLIGYQSSIAEYWTHDQVGNWLSMGKGFIHISDWPRWFTTTYVSIPEHSTINVTIVSYHEITSVLPSSWLAHGFWYYGYSGSDFIGWDTNTTDLNIAKAINQSNTYDRVVSVEQFGSGRAVYLGFNVFGYAADVYSKQLFKNAIRWSAPSKKVVWQYHFNLSPFIDQVWVNVTPQAGGSLIFGYVNLTSFSYGYPASLLGWASGNNFYMAIDFQDEPMPGGFDMAFLVGTISTRTASMYRTYDGTTWIGPTSITLVPMAQEATTDSCISSVACSSKVDAQLTFQYRFTISPFIDHVWTNVTAQPGGSLLNGYANLTYTDPGYPASMLGWASGNNFYMAIDYKDAPNYYDMSLLVGTISTKTGKLYRTYDGTSWIGPTAVTLVPF